MRRYGNFGPNGEPAWLFYDRDSDLGVARFSLAFWEGDGFRIEPWGEVSSELIDASDGPIAARLIDGVHSDLVVSQPGVDSRMAVLPWGPSGPGSPVFATLTEGELINLKSSAVIDTDLDGHDEVAAESTSGFALFRAGEKGAEFWGQPTPGTGLCGLPSGVGWGDIDGDGALDFATTGFCTKPDPPEIVFTAWGGTEPPFATSQTYGGDDEILGWAGVADLDGDGFADLVYATDGSTSRGGRPVRLRYLRSRGNRTFDAPVSLWEPGTPGGWAPDTLNGDDYTPSPADFMLGDIDGDGTDDVVFTNSSVVVIGIAHRPAHLKIFDLPWDRNSFHFVSCADVNDDGRMDFLVTEDGVGHFALVSGD
jgi:hypothetical protein